MKSVYQDESLRNALHSIYVAQFKAIRKSPHAFTKADATRMLTSLMGSRPWSWRVIGITPAALGLLAENDFERPARQLQRGHIVNRADTAEALYLSPKKPFLKGEFFDFFLERDKTVIMTNAENVHRRSGYKLPEYIPISQKLELFPCGTLVGWQHRTQEVEFLRSLHDSARRNGKKIKASKA